MPVYDWRQLQRWRISEAALPPGSIIRFYEPGLWEKYRLQVVGVLAIILLQGSLIAWLAYEHRRRTACGGSVAQFHGRADPDEPRGDRG